MRLGHVAGQHSMPINWRRHQLSNHNERQKKGREAKEIRPGLIINIKIGRLTFQPPTEQVACGACCHQEKLYGMAEITEIPTNQRTCKLIAILPLCEACFYADQTERVLIRKIWKGTDIEIQNWGRASIEHILQFAAAVSEKHGAKEH